MSIAVNDHKEQRHARQNGRHDTVSLGTAEVMEGRERDDAEQKKNDILPETLRVRQMDGLAKAAAVHGRVQHPQHKRDDGEKAQQDIRENSRQLAQHTGNERHAHTGLQHRQRDAQPLGRRHHPRHLEETEILLQNEHGPHRVHHFQEARYQEDDAHQDCRKTTETLIRGIH